MLILDNAPSHPTALNDLCENVKVIYLPPNTTSIIQPMDQGVIASFKAYYLRRTFSQAIKMTTGDEAMTLAEFWKAFNIKNCIENVKEAWSEVTSSNLRAAWQRIIPNCANGFKGFKDEVNRVINDITKLGIDLGLTEIEKGDVQDLLQSHDKELDDEDLIDLERERAYDDQMDDNDEQIDVPPKEFTLKEMDEMFRVAEIFKDKILNGDPNLERSMKVRQEIENSIRCYRVLYEEKRKKKFYQTTLHQFLSRKE